MPSAKEPVPHLECPFEHKQGCLPHLPLEDMFFMCQCNSKRRTEVVPEECYIQLFETVHTSGQKSKLIIHKKYN